MANKSPEQIAQKFQRGIAGASQDYAEGVQNPSRPWATATAAAASRWRTGIQEAIQNNSFQRGVQKAGDAKWQQNAVNKGAQNYAGAAAYAAENYAKVAGQIVAAGAAARQAAQALPGDTMEQRLARATASMRATSNYWKNR